MKHTPDFVFTQAYYAEIYDRVNLRSVRPEGWTWSYMTSDLPPIKQVRWQQTLKMSFQGKLVRAKLINQNKQSSGGGKRGTITDFSPASRGRLFDLFNQFEVKHAATFITLTYASRAETAHQAKGHLRALFKRLGRLYPDKNLSGIWRMEFQQRGAIHFHIIFFECPYIPKEKLQTIWGDITGDKLPFTRIERIFSHKKIINYVAKYVGKVNGEPNPSGFNSLTYLSAYQKYHGPNIGRLWGYLNKSELPFAELHEIELPLYYAKFMKFRNMAAAYYPPLIDNISPGFKLYVVSAEWWRNKFHEMYDTVF